MQSDQRRRRKKLLRPVCHFFSCDYYSFRCCVFFLLFFPTFFLLYRYPSGPDLFRPVLSVFRIKPMSVTSSLVRDSTSNLYHYLRIEERVIFPDHLLLLIPTTLLSSSSSSSSSWSWKSLDCVYYPEEEAAKFSSDSSSSSQISTNTSPRPIVNFTVLSVDEFHEFRSIARCPLPPANYSAIVELRNRTENSGLLMMADKGAVVHSWERLVYAAVLDGNITVVFVKGLNLRPGRLSDPSLFSCHFNWVGSQRSNNFAGTVTTRAVTAAQEVVRCSLPSRIRNHPSEIHGVKVSVSVAPTLRGSRFRRRAAAAVILPSVAMLFDLKIEEKRKNKFELCMCTMVWNQALFLREWIIYHAWLGVERWFVYDNNSDDETVKVIEELQRENYNVSRHVWPWIKTQEAGFSSCALRARDECKWMAFMDVDEFFYFKFSTGRVRKKSDSIRYPDRDSLRLLVANFSSLETIGEIRTVCHSFGPSGLRSSPSHGVTVGYTCRLQSPERHKSIVRLDALHMSLLNLVHHFHLRAGYKYLNLRQNIAVINHYKYQVWDVFKAKFFRRVATYVTDWQNNQNEGSKDRAPGLGTEPIEPPNWANQFCEVWDTGLRDFIMAKLADPGSRVLPWERHLQ